MMRKIGLIAVLLVAYSFSPALLAQSPNKSFSRINKENREYYGELMQRQVDAINKSLDKQDLTIEKQEAAVDKLQQLIHTIETEGRITREKVDNIWAGLGAIALLLVPSVFNMIVNVRRNGKTTASNSK